MRLPFGPAVLGMLLVLLGLLLVAAPAAAEDSGEGAAVFPARAIDRPTSLPKWMPGASMTFGASYADGEYTLDRSVEVYLGLPAHFEAGLVLPGVQFLPTIHATGPTASLAYGWDITDTIALLPSVAQHVGVSDGDASATSAAVEATWTLTSAFEIGLLPSLQHTYGVESETEVAAAALAFAQFSRRFSLLFSTGPAFTNARPGTFATNLDATLAYTVASEGAIVGDLLVFGGLPQLVDTAHSDPLARWSDWQAGIGLSLYLRP